MASPVSATERQRAIAIVTSIHPDFDARIWKHAKSMAAAGWRVELIAPWTRRSEEFPPGITLHPFERVSSRPRRPVLVPLRIASRLRPVLHGVDVVHFHDLDILPWMSAVSLVKPVVYDVHEDYPEEMMIREWVPGLLRRPLALGIGIGQRLFARPIRNVVLTQPELEPEFAGDRFRRLYIYNYASLELTKGWKDDYLSRPPTVLFIGSQHVNNGTDLLIDIAARVRKVRPQVRFLASDRFANPELRAAAVARMEQLGADNMELIANVRPHELMSVLNRATVAISPNLRVKQQIRGAHNKIYEFMAGGLPQVLSDLPKQVEVVGGSDAGIMARPEDPDSFVSAIVSLVDDPALGHRLGMNGQRAFRERYSWESQMPALIGMYEDIIAGRR